MSAVSMFRRLLRRLGADRSGATAVEFAIIGPLFLGMVVAILETALVYFAGQALDTAVNSSTRIVRTGQAQAMSAEQYRSLICDGLYGMFDCDELRIVLRPLNGFSAYARTRPVDPDTGAWEVDNDFDPGEGSTVMVVEAYYKFPALFAIPKLTAGLYHDHTRLLATARVFKNEPF